MGCLLASCTSSNDPGLELNSTGFNAASMTAPDAGAGSGNSAAAAETSTSGEDDAELPTETGYLPQGNPSASQTAATAEAAEQPAAQQAEAAATPLPPNIASTQRGDAAARPLVPSTDAAAAPTASAAQSPRAYAAIAPRKRSWFGSAFASPANASEAPAPKLDEQPAAKSATSDPGQAFIENIPPKTFVENRPTKPIIDLDQAAGRRPVVLASLGENNNGLPGVRASALFEIKRKSGIDDDSDVDVHEEDDAGAYQVASAAGMARLAPNGLLKQTESVDVACLKPSLVRVLKIIEQRYGKKLVVTSGYRSRIRNIKARGAKNSLHMYCAAADIQVPGVGKVELANFLRAMPGRGGVGTYCHTNSVHIDVGPERDWNWRCRRRG